MRGRPTGYVIDTSSGQKIRLQHLCKLFGEWAYKIFPLAEPLKRSEDDLLVVSQRRHHPLVIRPALNEIIELRAYVGSIQHHPIQRALFRKNNYGLLKPLRWREDLPLLGEQEGWRKYVHPDCLEEAEYLLRI